jgi:DNA polymerase-3 subunit gamma/tau
MRDALSSLDQLIAFKEGNITEEDALSVFGLVSRSELEGLAGAILKGDSAAILKAVSNFDSAGKNMRRLAGELLMHFRNLVVLMALGPNSKSLIATPDQIRVLTAQAEGADAGRIFRVCDQLAELEDKLRHVLSVRTLIEMSLIRASRIATTATVEELLKAVRALKSGEPVEFARNPGAATPVVEPPAVSRPSAAPAAAPAPAPAAPPPPLNPAPAAEPVAASGVSAARKAILDDPKLNSMLDAFPGSGVTNIRDGL